MRFGIWAKALGIIFCVLLLALVFLAHRNATIDKFSQTAIGPNTAVSEVDEIAAFNGRYACESLLRIILSPEANQSNRIAAIKDLRNCDKGAASSTLAGLLQPQNGLGLRLAIADSLQSRPCPSGCIEKILHYQERIWKNEKTFEDHYKLADHVSWGTDKIEEDQKVLSTRLDSLLRKNNSITIDSLSKIYGLGGPYPSDFAIDLVGRLGMVSACELLVRSSEQSTSDPVITEKLNIQMSFLHCESH